MRTLEISKEAVVDAGEFTLEGRKIRKVRQSVARVERHGWAVEVVGDDDVSSELDEELAEVEADWRSRQPRLIGFAMTLGRLAVAITDPLRPHLLPQLTRVGTWTAAVLFGIGSMLAGRLQLPNRHLASD